jgi:hypothetical protein
MLNHETIDSTHAYHAALKKASDGSWEALDFVGVQILAIGTERFADFDLELRNCPCGSTLCRRVPPVSS